MNLFFATKLTENIHETPEGYLVCLGVPIGRVGEMPYAPGECPLEPGPDGLIHVVREASELFRKETVASFEGKSLTIKHPADFVGPANWRELTRGVLQNVRPGGSENEGDLLADVLVTDAEAIRMVKSGLREVSCGYEAEYIQMGVGRGVQRNIIGNHLALVEEGRAGSAYAINDHKGEKKMNWKDRIKAIFAKAQDEALKVAEDGEKEEKAKAAAAAKTGDAGAAGQPTVMNEGYDAVMAGIKDLGEKVAALSGGKPAGDGTTPASSSEPAKTVATDAEETKKMFDAISARLDKLEGKGTGDEDPDTMTDDEDEEEDETGDADFEASEKTGDTAARIEILVPGFKVKKGEKDPKGVALRAAYATADGKAVIDQFTGGKAPAFDKPDQVELLFTATSELLKRDRRGSLARTKTKDFQSVLDDHAPNSGIMTAEKMNELNSNHYGPAKTH